jgi:hypothetical protein
MRRVSFLTRYSHRALAAGLTTLAALAVCLLRLDDIVGLMGDDGWYALLGKALADGRGYRLISSAAAEILPLYPPAYPALLSVVFRVSPEFPQNLWLLKSISIAAIGAAAVLTYRYLVDHRQTPRDLALCIAAAVALTPAFVFLATSTLMSEPVFTAVQMLTVLLIERQRDGSAGALTILTRTAGVAVLAAGMVYLGKERQWRAALVHIAAAAVCLAPWLVYSNLHAPTDADRRAQGGQIAQPYAEHFWRSADGASIGARDLPARIQQNVWNVFSRDIGGIVVPALYRGPAESGQEVIDLAPPTAQVPRSMGNTTGTVIASSIAGALAILGFIRASRRRVTVAEILVALSLALTAVWPFPTYRFVLPLAPFLLFYLAEGIAVLMAPAARIALLSVVGLYLYDHAGYIVEARGARGEAFFERQFGDADEVIGWMNEHLTGEGAVATDRPPLVYLRTGRKTVAIDDLDGNWERWKALGVRYVVSLRSSSLPDVSHRYAVRFRSPAGRWVIEIM